MSIIVISFKLQINNTNLRRLKPKIKRFFFFFKANPHVASLHVWVHVRVHEQVLEPFLQPDKVRVPSRRDAQVLGQVPSRHDAPDTERERILFQRDVPVRVFSLHDDDEQCAPYKVHGSRHVH